MESVSKDSPVEASNSVSKSEECNLVNTLEEFPIPRREESENQDGTMSAKPKAKTARKFLFGLTMANAPGNPACDQVIEGHDQLPKKCPISESLQSDTPVGGNLSDNNTGAVPTMSESEFHDILWANEDKILALQQENTRLLETMNSFAFKVRQLEAVCQQANKMAKQLESELTDVRKKALKVKAASVHPHKEDPEKKALRNEVMKLRFLLEERQAEHEDALAALYHERIMINKDCRDAVRRANQLEASLTAMKNKAKETDIGLGPRKETESSQQGPRRRTGDGTWKKKGGGTS